MHTLSKVFFVASSLLSGQGKCRLIVVRLTSRVSCAHRHAPSATRTETHKFSFLSSIPASCAGQGVLLGQYCSDSKWKTAHLG